MLGVSRAATVGINFQNNYCGAPSYSGAIVTTTAFGIPASGWESLTQMMSGYGSAPCNLQNYSLSEIIDTTTAADGLNPLPNGALTINWSAATANTSGFSGGYKGNTGEAQVYHGFLRDGVNFGPGSSGGDNNQPNYNIDIVGLSSVFTNTPFVVQLIASADSMQTFTNAFVIDVTHSSTQSVVYASPFLETQRHDTPWVRGYGGGISSVTPLAISTDHLQITGNRAAHGGSIGGGDDYNRASTIAGFIITDKPVVTMSPQPVLAAQHDDVALRAIAAGVPPLHYQWRKNGTDVPGATTADYTIHDIASDGNYDVVVTNLYGSAISKPSAVTLDRLAITYDGVEVTVSWKYLDDTLTLQEADALLGPYNDVATLSPYVTLAGTTPKYYRYYHTVPKIIASNPHDM